MLDGWYVRKRRIWGRTTPWFDPSLAAENGGALQNFFVLEGGCSFGRWPARRVRDVEHLHGVIREPVEDIVGIANKRRDANVRALGDTAGALRPSADASKNEFYAPPDRGRYLRIVGRKVSGNCFQIGGGGVREDDFHDRRNWPNARCSRVSVAKRPCCASATPRSIAASSSGVAR